VLYCTSCANNFALQQKRKTLKDADVLSALEEMEFEHFLPNLKEALDNFKKEKRNASEKKKKAKEVSENAASPKPDKDDQMNELDKSDGKDTQENSDIIAID
jgi:DNA polymerase epsilon subunit 3